MGKSFLSERIAQRDVQFSVGGKIRVGTKAISKKAAGNPKAAALFQKAQQGLISFREAEKEIYRQCEMANPFYPRNTQEFHAHPWDMNTGGAATTRRLLELYGESRGSDVSPKLYRFPVVFPDVMDHDLDTLVGGGLAVQGGGAETIRYRSRYEPDGTRNCVYLPPVTRTEQTKRKIVQHVPRQPVVRGACVPEECEEYAFGMCKFGGKLRFFVPGIAGAGVFELHTGSTEAASQIYLRLSQAMNTCNGRLPNFTPDGRPVFWLSKERAVRQYFDETGMPKMGEQWVPTLDMEIELPKVMWLKQQEAMLLPHVAKTSHSTSGITPAVPSAWSTAEDAGIAIDVQASNDAKARGTELHAGDSVGQQQGPRDGAEAASKGSGATDRGQGGSSDPAMSTEHRDEEVDPMSLISDHAEAGGYADQFVRWAELRWGVEWQDKPLEVFDAWKKMVDRFGEMTKDYLCFVTEIHTMNLQQDLVVKYMQFKFGNLSNGQQLGEFRKELARLCEDGASVATELMASALEEGNK